LDKELVIFSDNFGTSFSGGCTATANFTRYWKDTFKKIHVVCKQTDGFLKDEIVVWLYSDQDSLEKILSGLAMKQTIGYGDFHTSVEFIRYNIPFYFTYHDNYPEMQNLDTLSSEAEMMLDDYANVFSRAQYVFSVSAYKLDYIKRYTDKCVIVRNGISQPITKRKRLELGRDGCLKILMAGNISNRKYRYAIDLFDLIVESDEIDIEVDIFGSHQDVDLLNHLRQYEFVKVAPFQGVISYDKYHIYLCTSTMENLSLSVVDSIMNCTPVLAFDVGGLHEVVNNNNGVLVSPYSVEEMLIALQKMQNSMSYLNFDQDKLKEFDWEQSANSMTDIMLSNL
jgi:glycosyltransferase involved in cell wall biosynthesis